MVGQSNKFKKRGEKIKKIKNIKEIIELGNFEFSKKAIEFFLEEYGVDVEILYQYGKLLRKTGEFEKAICTFKYVLEYQKKQGLVQFTNCAKKELFKVYFINDYYEEAYQLFPQIKDELDAYEIYNKDGLSSVLVEKILQVKLGIYQGNLDDEDPVILKLLHYDKESSLEHIRKHLIYDNEVGHSTFNDLDISNLYEIVKKVLPQSKKTQIFSIHDSYSFYFSGVGNCSNHLTVITNKGTQEIITMYPDDSKRSCIINYNLYDLHLEQQTSKVKRLSQIEKFNQRYTKK